MEEQIEKEDPCTSYSHLEGNKELSRRETPSLGRKEKKILTILLPKYMQGTHEYFRKVRREIDGESQRGFETEGSPRFANGEDKHSATHHDGQRSQRPNIPMRRMK